MPALPVDRRVGKRWAQSVIADPSAAAGIDLEQVERLDVIGDSADGRLWILDVAAAPDALAAVPERRMPTVSLGSLTVTEGDRRGTSVARLPFTVTGELTRPAHLVVGMFDQFSRRGRNQFRLDLAPGLDRAEHRHQRDQRLARPDIALQQPQHRHRLRHVAADFLDHPGLRAGQRVRQPQLAG